jgi:hypothetical protein
MAAMVPIRTYRTSIKFFIGFAWPISYILDVLKTELPGSIRQLISLTLILGVDVDAVSNEPSLDCVAVESPLVAPSGDTFIFKCLDDGGVRLPAKDVPKEREGEVDRTRPSITPSHPGRTVPDPMPQGSRLAVAIVDDADDRLPGRRRPLAKVYLAQWSPSLIGRDEALLVCL